MRPPVGPWAPMQSAWPPRHVCFMKSLCRPVSSTAVFFSPRVFEIDALSQLTGEVFGPVLHVIRYAARDLDKVIDQINNTGYGPTAGGPDYLLRFAGERTLSINTAAVGGNTSLLSLGED